MIMLHEPTLTNRCLDLYQSFMTVSLSSTARKELLRRWLEYEEDIAAALRDGSLDAEAASVISTIVGNVRCSASTLSSLEKSFEQEIESLSDELENVVIGSYSGSAKRHRIAEEAAANRTSKRNCRPTTTKYLPTPSPPPPSKSLKTTHTKPTPSSTNTTAPDPVRQYFLNHLASPYPSPSEKISLCKKANITRRKLESDLTNWRRRSDWTDIMNTYCGGDKGAMKTMVSAIERGEEGDEELLERFGRMRAYLEKRDEKAGEWVYELAEAVESGRLDELRFHQIDDNSDGSESEEEERYHHEEDAEGETESESQSRGGYQYRPSTPLKSLRYSKQDTGPYTTVPLNMTIPNPALDSPLTDLSPSSVGSHISVNPNLYFPNDMKVQHPPPAQHMTYQPSAKSSYSSLSAASNAAGPRKRNISDSSTTSNIRSTSGSSTSSFPDERRTKESFSRSRSRVEDILSDHSTAPSWVSGHAPNEGFHIGADPRFMTQIPHQYPNQLQQGQAPPPYELGPYLMAPTWNGDGTWNQPMPHMPRSTEGGFRMPGEYEFTFNQPHGQGYGGQQAGPVRQ